MKRTNSSRKLQMNNGTQLERIEESKLLESNAQNKIQGALLKQLNILTSQKIYNRAFNTALQFKIENNNSQMQQGKFEGKLTYKIRVLLYYNNSFFDNIKKILLKYSSEHTNDKNNFQKELEHRYDELFQDNTYIEVNFS